MRRSIALGFICGLWGITAWGAEPTFPYEATIAVDQVEVRCGPGWDYYATQTLSRGARVEVYRHDPGGWLAIRPPQGSFSWITARHLKATTDRGVSEVLFDGAVAWVGSMQTDPVQHKWQVRLNQGERVETLGDKSLSVGPGFATETFVKVAPPAGEFRWIHAEQARAKAADGQTLAATQPPPAVRSVGGPATGNGERSSEVNPAQRAVSKTPAPSSDVAANLAALHVDLSLLVAQSIDDWDLASLRQRVEALSQRNLDDSQQHDVESISRRIAEFQTLQQRHQKALEPTADEDREVSKHGITVAPNLLPSGSASAGAEADALEVAPASGETQDSPFAAEGWLMPVHSTKRVAPPFALLDDDGRVQAYVTPAPGLNLRRYTKKYVGIVGEKAYVASLRANHVSAQRVVKQDK